MRNLLASLVLLAPALCLAQPRTYTIRTVAGNGTPVTISDTGTTSVGDSGQALSANINNPVGLLLDTGGNLLVADSLNNRIRRIGTDGVITTIVGSGVGGFGGDGAAATSARILRPSTLAIDSSGTLTFVDAGNHVVRRVASGGNISTIAGTAAAGFNGDLETAVTSQLNFPVGVALDSSGATLIADTLNHRIRRVTSDGKIATFAGSGIPGYAGDGAAAVDAYLRYPQGIAVFGGSVYFSDTYNDVIRKVDSSGIISTVAGNGIAGFSGDGGPAISAQLNYPRGIAFDAGGNLYIADSFNSRIRMVDPEGRIWTIAGTGAFGFRGDGGPARLAQLRFPGFVMVGPGGTIYVSDTQNHRIRLLAPDPVSPTSLPIISSTGVRTSSAFGGFEKATPGTWVEIYGTNLAAVTRAWTADDFDGAMAPTTLAGTEVLVGGQRAYISYVSPNQINALLPSSAGFGDRELRVVTRAGSSAAYAIALSETLPGLLAPAPFQIGERQFVAATLGDGATYALAEGAVAGLATRPARPGERITLYGVGFGTVSPYFAAGRVVDRANSLDRPVEILFGDVPAAVTYQGLAPGGIGLYQFNVTVPNVEGEVPLRVRQGGVAGEQILYIAVAK